jgi:hypothetical protein
VVSDSPSGPWTDPLGKPLLPEDLTPTHEYDMGIYKDVDGEYYIVFGVWDYYIARLNEDMVSLAEKPRKITINNPHGPYNQDGTNSEKPTDDKPFLHFHNGHYYLSWGCFYAMADNVYGPYDYAGSIIEQESFAPGYDSPTWPNGFKQGRHGSFFQWYNQWYFAYCDISQTGNRYFRDTFISYVHYKSNGEMALIRVDGTGVGEYNANQTIEAEDYFKASGVVKKGTRKGGFRIGGIGEDDYLVFNNIHGLKNKNKIWFGVLVHEDSKIEIRKNNPEGTLITTCTMTKEEKKGWYEFVLPQLNDTENLCFVFRGKIKNLLELDAFYFGPAEPHLNGKLTLTEFDEMFKKKQLIWQKDESAVLEYDQLIEKANTALRSGPFSVVHKTGIPPSGDKHDYMSIGPYWWPNPNSPDELPYIRRDGEVNPETRNNSTDYVEKSAFFDAVNVLGKAFFYSENTNYAQKAVSLIKTWFLDEATRMNPNLNFGQGIPGKTDGRPFGIIEFGGIPEFLSCLELLKHSCMLDTSVEMGMKKWLSDYAQWLQTSEMGTMEGTRKNNHGTWYDVQLCSIFLYLGDTVEIKDILEKAKSVRIASQIQPDGSQPLELDRTKSFSYSTMNLAAFTRLAQIGKKVGVDLWNFETEDGRSIKQAYKYLIPYAIQNKKWEYRQITDIEEAKERFTRLLKEAVTYFEDEEFFFL